MRRRGSEPGPHESPGGSKAGQGQNDGREGRGPRPQAGRAGRTDSEPSGNDRVNAIRAGAQLNKGLSSFHMFWHEFKRVPDQSDLRGVQNPATAF